MLIASIVPELRRLPAHRLLRFNGDEIPIIKGSALCALKGEKPEVGKASILKLMEVRAQDRSRASLHPRPPPV